MSDVMRRCMTRSERRSRSRLAGALLAAALGLFSAPALATEAAEQARERIAVEGNRRVDTETVRSYFHAAPDGRFDEAARDAALKALLATGLFDKVTIERAGERLVVHLTEAPVLDRVAFEGNKKIQDKELAAVMNPNRAARCSAPWCRPTSAASWTLTAMPGATMSAWCRRSSAAAMTGSTSSMW